MFEFREHFESQLREQTNLFVKFVAQNRARHTAYWAGLSLICLIVFACLTFVSATYQVQDTRNVFTLAIWIFTYFLMKSSFTNSLEKLANLYNIRRNQFKLYLRNHPYRILEILGVIHGALTFICLYYLIWDLALSESLVWNSEKNSSLTSFLSVGLPTFSALLLGLLAVQVTLLTSTGNFYSERYASCIVRSVLAEGLFYFLLFLTGVWLAVVVAITFFGLPEYWIHQSLFLPFFATLINFFINTFVTLSLGLRVMSPERAIQIVGARFAEEVKLTIPNSIPIKEPSNFGKFLLLAQLDFKAPRRYNPLILPVDGVNLAIEYADALTEVATLAIREQKTRVLQSALDGICKLTESYATARSSYTVSSDQFFERLWHNVAMLNLQVIESPNQSLHVYVVMTIGNIGKIAVSVGRDKGLQSFSKDNPLILPWINLLQESCLKMATAERSHGSSRALEELKGIFLKCCMEGLYESIQFAVLPAYTDVLKKFMIDDTLYGNYLANRILSDFLFLWTNTFIITKEVERRYPILKNTQKNFFVLLSTKIVVSAHGKDNLNFGPDLTAKSKEAVIVISEAFSIGFYLPLIAPVEAYLRVKLLIEFLEKFAEATQLGIKSKLAHVGFFVSNFYECCFLVLQGFPKHLLIDVAYQPTSSGEIQFEESEKNQNAFEFAVIECLDKVLSQVLTDSSNLHSDEYEWLFSLIGMLLIKSNYKPNLRIECEKLISKVRDAVKKELEERSNSYLLPYLQLLGAWRSVDSSPNSLGDGVEALLKNYYAEQRSQRGYVDFRSARTETGWMGYPEYNIGGGIFIPPLRNININRDEYFKVRDILLNMEVLKRYAITVGAIESDDDETI